MNALWAMGTALLGFFLAYFTYARFISHRILSLDPELKTPAHTRQDGIDYVPTNRYVLFRHHFASIAGAAPIVSSAIAVSLALFLCTVKLGQDSTGIALWPLFGVTNQVLAALALLIITFYLLHKGRSIKFTLPPFLFMLAITASALLINLRTYFIQGNWLLLMVGSIILVLELWLVVEAVSLLRTRRMN